MSEGFDLVVRGGTCVTPAGTMKADVGVRDGRIAAIGDLSQASAAEEFDATHLHVLPGFIDPQVHFREPGGEEKEDLASGTEAAVRGGVTSVLEMPNTNPPTISAATMAEKVIRARRRSWCDIAFFVGAHPDNLGSLGELERSKGCCGVKIFMGESTGGLLIENDEQLVEALRNGSRRVAVHAEDQERLEERRSIALEPGATAHVHPQWRDEQTALLATQRLIAAAREAGRRVHVLHVTTAEEIEFLAQHKDIATVEVPPQHLTLVAPDCYDQIGNYARMNPPIRDQRHQDALWAGIQNGVVDVLGSDHAPHTRADKDQPYADAPSGMPGVQTLVPVMLDHVHAGRLTLERLVDLSCAGPARVWGLARKGRLAVGNDADLTIVDLAAKRKIENRWIASRCGWTPFDDHSVTGWPRATVLRGSIVMREDELIGEPRGELVGFEEVVAPPQRLRAVAEARLAAQAAVEEMAVSADEDEDESESELDTGVEESADEAVTVELDAEEEGADLEVEEEGGAELTVDDESADEDGDTDEEVADAAHA